MVAETRSTPCRSRFQIGASVGAGAALAEEFEELLVALEEGEARVGRGLTRVGGIEFEGALWWGFGSKPRGQRPDRPPAHLSAEERSDGPRAKTSCIDGPGLLLD